MKVFLLLIGVSITPALLAQNDRQAIQQWQSSHPATILISAERYNGLSQQEQQLLGSDVIVFQEKITLAQLEQYDVAKNGALASKPAAKDEEPELVKQWLGMHPDVKIIPRSLYDSLPDEQRLAYDQPYCMILQGETITAKDIELFGQ